MAYRCKLNELQVGDRVKIIGDGDCLEIGCCDNCVFAGGGSIGKVGTVTSQRRGSHIHVAVDGEDYTAGCMPPCALTRELGYLTPTNSTTDKEEDMTTINDPVKALRDKVQNIDATTLTLRKYGMEHSDGTRTDAAKMVLLDQLWAERREAVANDLTAMEAAESEAPKA